MITLFKIESCLLSISVESTLRLMQVGYGVYMLVLTRKPGDGIVIGDDIIIKFIELKNGAIRVGIEAPQDKKIYRQEIYERISVQNREAIQWDMTDLDVLSGNLEQRKQKK